MIALPDTYGSEGPAALVDWFARMLVVELAIVSVAAGTYPIIRRGAITAGELAIRVGLPSQVERIRRALRESFAAGLLIRRSPDDSEIAIGGQVLVPPWNPPVSSSLPLTSEQIAVSGKGKDLSDPHISSVAGESEAVSGKGKISYLPIPPTPRDGEVAVFDAWRKAFSRGKATKLDATRLRAIRKALLRGPRGLGFELADVLAAIRGYARDPWRREQAVRNELSTLLRNAAQIEAGIELGKTDGPIRRPAVAAAPGDDVDEARGEAARRRAPSGPRRAQGAGDGPTPHREHSGAPRGGFGRFSAIAVSISLSLNP